MHGRVKRTVSDNLPLTTGRSICREIPRASQFALTIGRAASDRTNPGGLPRFECTSSQSPEEPTTLIRVPLPICEIARAEGDGLS